MPKSPWELDAPPLPDIRVPPTPEVVDIPADLPTLEPSEVIKLPLNESITDAAIVPDEHNETDVLYVAVSQERVNVWAAVVYFVPEIALGLSILLVLVATRKLWVGRRFVHRKGEAYCKKCWAGLTGVQSDTCPECGRAVAKTKRIAKRSRCSPLSPRWLWGAAALLASLGTATLWFGEGWYRLYQDGFDPNKRSDWLALVDPLEKDSTVRINKMAGRLDWRSAWLAGYARNRDHAWIETLAEEYVGGEGLKVRLLVRRYSTSDCGVLSEDMLPADWPYQDRARHEAGLIYLEYKAGVLLVHDGLDYFRYRHGQVDPYVQVITDPDDGQTELSQVAVSADGRHLFAEWSKRDLNAGLFRGYSDPWIIVYDLETGEQVARLQITISNRFVDQIDPKLIHDPGSRPATDAFSFDYHTFTAINRPGQLLLGSSDDAPIWNYLDHEITIDNAQLAPGDLRADLTLEARNIYGQFIDDRGRNRSEADRLLREGASALRDAGWTWATIDMIAPFSRAYHDVNAPSVPWDIYQSAQDILLYDPEQISGAYHQAARIMRLESGIHEIVFTELSPGGRWLHVSVLQNQQGGGATGRRLRIDTKSGEAIGWFADGFQTWRLLQKFVNSDTGFIAVYEVTQQPTSRHSRFDRSEIHLYQLTQ